MNGWSAMKASGRSFERAQKLLAYFFEIPLTHSFSDLFSRNFELYHDPLG